MKQNRIHWAIFYAFKKCVFEENTSLKCKTTFKKEGLSLQ